MVNTRSTKYNEETTTMDDERRTNDDDKRTVRRQKGERKSDDKRTEKKLRGDIRKSVSPKKRIKKKSSWSMYRRQFEAAAKANGWTPQEMATSLVISLRGQALEILQSIPEEQQNDYDRIVGALEIRYGHKYLRQVYQSQIKSRQQRSNESLQEYEADVERLVHLAYPQTPKEFFEQIGIQTFIDGLVDIEMQQALRLGRHNTISDALVAALEFKAAKEASRSYKFRVRQVKFDECQSLKETVDKLMRELNEIKQSNSPQKETRRCYNCGRIGHLQRFCRTKTRYQPRSYSPDR
ncbi:hypothetical protein NQ318_009171 [Aromia moschata]|uniref:CCHC-type domain-containing protein n=1 Tax=Aromia moschata TaxID=1265417 RepID=A0AAV8XXS4_9CUCU|nr:hypothetical protein NQ318_009171 [Aromia moschata]